MAPRSNQREQPVGESIISTHAASAGVLAERHYSVAEVAKMWNLSTDMIRRLFAKEPGVLVFERDKGRVHKRRYATLRIPESVVERVHRRCSLVT